MDTVEETRNGLGAILTVNRDTYWNTIKYASGHKDEFAGDGATLLAGCKRYLAIADQIAAPQAGPHVPGRGHLAQVLLRLADDGRRAYEARAQGRPRRRFAAGKKVGGVHASQRGSRRRRRRRPAAKTTGTRGTAGPRGRRGGSGRNGGRKAACADCRLHCDVNHSLSRLRRPCHGDWQAASWRLDGLRRSGSMGSLPRERPAAGGPGKGAIWELLPSWLWVSLHRLVLGFWGTAHG